MEYATMIIMTITYQKLLIIKAVMYVNIIITRDQL